MPTNGAPFKDVNEELFKAPRDVLELLRESSRRKRVLVRVGRRRKKGQSAPVLGAETRSGD